MLRAFIRDAIEMSRVATGEVTARSIARTVFLSDSYAVMATTRIREASRRWHVPGVNRLLRLTQSVLFGIASSDPVTRWSAAGLLLIVALGASWIPARRAAHVHPMDALRRE